ncbi:MAG: SagB/ThcOx family dehydrogenase [Cyanobacteria bacterium HKST-UBA02]|nr:SagB/ThcOx family dehydrogenase [Cyanobacteria bacterium HKST-UBA02]
MSSNPTTGSLTDTDIYGYHRLTKHTVESLFTRGPGLDWANQPDPFLRYEGAPVVELPANFTVSNLDFFQIISILDGSSADLAPEVVPCGLDLISNLLFYGMSISAWKQIRGTDHRWALRVNASSGNLHPTETFVLCGRQFEEEPGIGLYHYRVDRHVLERRSEHDMLSELWPNRANLIETITGQSQEPLPEPDLAICLGSIFFRESWKYRRRAYRYCQHDLGHALSALVISARALGYRSVARAVFPDAAAAELLGLNGGDSSSVPGGIAPLCILALYRQDRFPEHDFSLSVLNWSSSCNLEFIGSPIRLASEIVDYPEIEAAHTCTSYSEESYFLLLQELANTGLPKTSGRRPGPVEEGKLPLSLVHTRPESEQDSVHETVRSRRSAVDMDGKTGISLEDLSVILWAATTGFRADFQIAREMSTGERRRDPFYLVHLYVYVHRVEGLAPGLYYLERESMALLPVMVGDQREFARGSSCFQDIAMDGAFALSMVADMSRGLELFSQRFYRLVHYEAGFIGQLVYLASRARGIDSTGIGCFIDGAINEYLGLRPGFEVIYNFTVGRAVIDSRLTTLSSYDFVCPFDGSSRLE